MRGYAGKFIDVDLTAGSVEEFTIPEETLRLYIGGRGLAARVLWDRLGERWEEVVRRQRGPLGHAAAGK